LAFRRFLDFFGEALREAMLLSTVKVFELCTRFQLFSQPNGLCSSSGPCVPRFISVFDSDLPTFRGASSVSPFVTDFTPQSGELVFQLGGFARENLFNILAKAHRQTLKRDLFWPLAPPKKGAYYNDSLP
jgi:hypothetical protein